ncbi:MAG: carbonic anhydrase [Sphingomonadaceae bacterium]|jgi:carbonic anhydrase|nr:carbonic anhydrase [Sphingomonadaceae bacterium]NBU78483.1 carbonic anhydrase [Sphingomonadaceae bacterium]NCA01984.1 carbonic anhydrase [Sphingomonadaceae bacterium]
MPEFKALIEGYKRFRADAYREQKARYDELASDGQAPPVMVISCCDSRVDPATIFDTVPGQVFALRNVANLVPPFETGGGLHGASAAIEFGVLGLGVKHIVVMGHGQCGGIKAALADAKPGPSNNIFIDSWMGIVRDARDAVVLCQHDDPQRALEWEAIKVSLANLRTFPFIAEREAAGELKLHGSWFAISEGSLYVLDEDSGSFSVA